MAKSHSDYLHRLLEGMGRHALKPDWDRESVAKRSPRATRGPSEWDTIEPSDFGPEWDYLTVPLSDERTAIVCKSKAALHWCYDKLGDIDRYSNKGFVIEDRYLDFVERCMQEAGCMSHTEYVDSMEEMNDKMRQWE